jgi:hypothetical protein
VNKKIASIVLGASIFAVTACSSVSTSGSTVSLQYANGPFDTKAFTKCWPENQKSLSNDPGDDYFYYPAGQRDYDFGDGDDKDSVAFTSTSFDSQDMKIQGVVKFELNTECKEYTDAKGKKWPGGVLQYMHENFTAQRGAYGDEDGKMPEAWSKFLTAYLGAAVDKAIDNSSLRFGWQDLNNNLDVKVKWESGVKEDAERIVKTLTQDVPIFKVTAVVLQKPEAPEALRKGLTEKQAAILQKEATDIVANAGATFPGGVTAYQKFLEQQAINEAIKQGKAQIYVVPQGTDVVMGK